MGNATINLPVIKSGYVRQDYPTTVFRTSPGAEYEIDDRTYQIQKVLYFGFQSIPDNLKNRRLYDMRFFANGRAGTSSSSITWAVGFIPNNKDFDPASLIYENRPRGEGYPSSSFRISGSVGSSTADFTASDNYGEFSSRKSKAVQSAVKYGLQSQWILADAWLRTIRANSGAPYIEITYDDSINVKSQIAVSSGPASGYVNPRKAIDVSWWFDRKATETYYCAGYFTQASAALKWRVSGGNWNTINASGSTPMLTIPANTFPTASTIEWYLTGTDTAGTSSETPHYTISTAAGTANAKAISPVSSVEDGSQPITLRWELSSTDGQAPAAIDLWWKLPETSSQNWTVILNHAAAKTSHTVDAGYFPAGECQWMVRGYNVDDVPGPWSYINGVSGNYPSFVCVAAPDAPAGLQATQVPRTTVSWQSEGQEAYEIEIDGASARKAFGPSVNSWQVQEPLEDGTHSIRVRVQGVYGLWSAWSETTVIAANDPPTTAELDGRFDTDAELILLPASVPDPLVIQWYRDGKRIARTTGTPAFSDRLALGSHSYYAEIWYDSGYYVRSNTVAGTLCSRCTRIASTDYGSPWIELQLSDDSNSAQAFNWSRDSSLRQMRGAKFPVLELSEFENLTGSYSCAFPDMEGVKDLEALKGKTVIVKSRGGRVLIGALSSLSVSMKNFFITCSFTIRQIEWEDFVRYDPNA